MPKKSLKITIDFMLFSLFEKKLKKITLPFTLKSNVKAKERRIIYGNSNIFHHSKKYNNLQKKILQKETKNP
jgi:hypothetical protein